jgi:hypothetical protein
MLGEAVQGSGVNKIDSTIIAGAAILEPNSSSPDAASADQASKRAAE